MRERKHFDRECFRHFFAKHVGGNGIFVKAAPCEAYRRGVDDFPRTGTNFFYRFFALSFAVFGDDFKGIIKFFFRVVSR